MRIRTLLRAVWMGIGALLALLASPVYAQELLSNGDFELGSLANWTTAEQPSGFGAFYIASDVFAPISGLQTAGPAGGSFYALSDMSGYGAQALLQIFTVPAGSFSVIVSFDMFVNDMMDYDVPVQPCSTKS